MCGESNNGKTNAGSVGGVRKSAANHDSNHTSHQQAASKLVTSKPVLSAQQHSNNVHNHSSHGNQNIRSRQEAKRGTYSGSSSTMQQQTQQSQQTTKNHSASFSFATRGASIS